MFRDSLPLWAGMTITVIVYILLIFFASGCAAPDPAPPIRYYREAYGFPTIQ